MMDATATILPFPIRAAEDNRLLAQDKAEAYEWEEGALRLGYDRVVVHEQSGGSKPEESDFLLIYRVGHRWARRGAARQGQCILLWRCGTGAQAGAFPSMRSALDALPLASEAFLAQPCLGPVLVR